MDWSTLQELAKFIVSLLLLMGILYLCTRIFCGYWLFTLEVGARLFVTAVIAILMIPAFEHLLGMTGISGVGFIVTFFVLVLATRFIIVEDTSSDRDWVDAVLITILSLVIIYIVNWIVPIVPLL
jgi:hypothetical protein